jgi:hypothetical protein
MKSFRNFEFLLENGSHSEMEISGCDNHAKIVASRPDLGYCIPLCGFLVVIQLVRNRGHEVE